MINGLSSLLTTEYEDTNEKDVSFSGGRGRRSGRRIVDLPSAGDFGELGDAGGDDLGNMRFSTLASAACKALCDRLPPPPTTAWKLMKRLWGWLPACSPSVLCWLAQGWGATSWTAMHSLVPLSKWWLRYLRTHTQPPEVTEASLPQRQQNVRLGSMALLQ